MSDFDAPTLVWLLAGLQVFGLASAWLTRLSEGSNCQTLCQRTFVLLLTLTGLATVISLSIGPGHGVICGATLSIMVLTAVCDFSGSRRASAI